MNPVTTCAVVGWLAIHLGAIASAWGTRISVGSRAESAMRFVFFTLLAVVGLTAWCCQHLEFGFWFPSGLTLVAMVLTAVTDFRRTHEPAPSAHATFAR